MSTVTHGIITFPFDQGREFSNTLSDKTIEGFEVISSGLDGVAGGWWAIIRKVEQ